VSKLAVGIEVGASAVRLAVVNRTRSGPELLHLGRVPIPLGVVSDGEVVDADAVSSAVKTMLHTYKLGSRCSARLGMVNARTLAREVELPWVPKKDFAGALPLLAADLLTMLAEDCVLDFLTFEEYTDVDGQRAIRGLLVAAPDSSILTLIDAVEAGGVEVNDVTLTPLATLAAVADGLAPGPEALVDIGLSATTLTIHEGGQPRFVRVINRGGADLTTSISEQLNLSLEDAELWKCGIPQMWPTMTPTDQSATETVIRSALADLIQEIRTSIEFFASAQNRRIVRAYVVGGGASTMGLVPILAGVLRVPVTAVNAQIVRPHQSLSALERDLACSPSLTSVVSLALGVAA